MAQKAILLLFQIREPESHPVESRAEMLKVFRATHLDRRTEIRLAETSYGVVDLRNRPGDQNREADDQKDDNGKQRKQLPQRDALRLTRGGTHVLDFTIDQRVAAPVDLLGALGKSDERLNRFLHVLTARLRIGKQVVNGDFPLDDFAQS